MQSQARAIDLHHTAPDDRRLPYTAAVPLIGALSLAGWGVVWLVVRLLF